MTADRILVADPDSKPVHLLRQILAAVGFEVISANKVDRALQMAAEEQPVLLITEFSLQSERDGIDLIRRIREFSDIPVIFLSENTETNDVLRGFEAGADDFIAKPFDARILVARIKAVLGRYKTAQGTTEIITCQNLSINQVSRQVTLNEVPIYLTETEYNLLLELAKHRDQVMLHEQLLIAVWGPQYRHEMDYLRSYIHILRRKLEGNSSKPSLIVSLSGIGYKLVSTPSEGQGK
jgi:two-component system, OmpR family, KDP operon response regulator KdpE